VFESVTVYNIVMIVMERAFRKVTYNKKQINGIMLKVKK